MMGNDSGQFLEKVDPFRGAVVRLLVVEIKSIYRPFDRPGPASVQDLARTLWGSRSASGCAGSERRAFQAAMRASASSTSVWREGAERRGSPPSASCASPPARKAAYRGPSRRLAHTLAVGLRRRCLATLDSWTPRDLRI